MPVPVSRDRLSRPVDISTLFDGSTCKVNLIVDEPGLKRVGLSQHGFTNLSENGGGVSVEGGAGVQRLINGRVHDRQTTVVTARRGGGGGDGGRGRRGQLPSWYPRTPLRDITDIMRAIERRRAELRLNQVSETPEAHDDNAANLEVDRERVVSTPMPTIVVKPRMSPAAQLSIMKAINAEFSVDNFDSLTPQKQLLNSIEKVRQVWVHQRRKLEKTPCAKRVERENKVRVLMSMR